MLQMAKFWPFLAPVWSEVVETGIKYFGGFLQGINIILRILAQKSFSEPGDVADGQVLAISGTGVV